jgi:hypothetical protein
MDGTGLPMVAKETEGRSGKGEDGRAHTREAKLGWVFTQTATDDQGRPVREEDSTTYTGGSSLSHSDVTRFCCSIWAPFAPTADSERCRSPFRADGDRDSEVMPITIPR